MKAKYPAIIVVILILLTVVAPKFATAKEPDEGRPIRLFVNEGAGPIGRIESLNPMAINGRMTRGEQLLWSGDILQAPIDNSVRVSLDSIGQVTLRSGAVARLAVSWRKSQDGTDGSILIASVILGAVSVKLLDNAEGYIEVSGSALTSSRGARFEVGVGEDGPVWNAIAGTVRAEPQTVQGNYMIRPVGGRANIDVRLRKTREVQFQVTDEHDKPVPDLPVGITISGTAATLGSGATTVTVTTNAAGIATAPVSAGTAVGTSTVTATVPGGASATVKVSAVPAGVLTGTTIGIIAAAAAAGTTTVIVVKTKDEIKPTADPVITPSSVRVRR